MENIIKVVTQVEDIIEIKSCPHCRKKFKYGDQFLDHILKSKGSYKPKLETCAKFGVSICLKCRKYLLKRDESSHICDALLIETRLL